MRIRPIAAQASLYESHENWKDVNTLARQRSSAKALEIRGAPFHNGAICYFKEIDAWSE